MCGCTTSAAFHMQYAAFLCYQAGDLLQASLETKTRSNRLKNVDLLED